MQLISKINLRLMTWMLGLACAAVIVGCSAGGGNDTAGMMKTSHGYSMKLVKDVDGPTPTDGDVVLFGMKVYAGDSLLTSTFEQEFDQEFKWMPDEERQKLNNPVIDAFEMMSEGDSAKILYPIDSMKGNNFGLESGDNLVYLLKMTKVMNADDYAIYAQGRQQKMQAERAKVQAQAEEVGTKVDGFLADYKANKFGNDLLKDESGLEYVIHEKGSGATPKVGEQVTVQYYGVLKSDGSMFDNSFRRGEPFSFKLGVGQVIPGWDKGVALLPKGSKATLFIPYELAYGAAGKPPTIPEKSDLVFYIEVPE